MATKHYLIEELRIEGLWGMKSLHLKFHSDVNIIIGPNASGKTTILNILRYMLTPEPLALRDLEFRLIVLSLRSFTGDSKRVITVSHNGDAIQFETASKMFSFPIDSEFPERLVHASFEERRLHRAKLRELSHIIRGLVPAVWLPVSRRLPITGEDEDELYAGHSTTAEARRRRRLESVDHRLRELTRELAKYRLQLDATLALRYKDFERRVLEIILYNKRHDRLDVLLAVRSTDIPKADEKELLIRSFQEAGLLNSRMRDRIDEHFKVAEEVLARVARQRSDFLIEDIAIMPLIPRTRAMIDAARDLESARESLFTPIRNFERIISSFFVNKIISVRDDGELSISMGGLEHDRLLPVEKLSSGEKQLLILLTQALLRADEPDVYVADEPELSLHVTWQAKLLPSLVELGGQIQIIVATHSPDIVGPYRDRIIDLGRPR